MQDAVGAEEAAELAGELMVVVGVKVDMLNVEGLALEGLALEVFCRSIWSLLEPSNIRFSKLRLYSQRPILKFKALREDAHTPYVPA